MAEEQNTPLTPVRIRELAKLTQTKMSALLDVRQGTVSDWDTRKSVPRLKPSQWLLLMSASGCTPEQLVAAYEPEEIATIPIRLQAVGLGSSSSEN